MTTEKFTLTRKSGKNVTTQVFDTFAQGMETFARMRGYVLHNMAVSIEAHHVDARKGYAFFAASGNETRPWYRYSIELKPGL